MPFSDAQVHDSNGVYRYCIGILADVAALAPNAREEVERLRRLLPTHFDARQQPLKLDSKGKLPPVRG